MADLETFEREEWLHERLRFHDGEHGTAVGPTGSGKSWLVWQMLGQLTSQHRPGVVLLKKPRDATTERYARQLGYRVERSWPPAPGWWRPKPPGWVVHPPTAFDPLIDRPRKALVFRKALLDAYRRNKTRYPKGVIAYVDDAYGISEILKLRQELIELWTEMRSMDGALFTGFQKPSHVPTWAYSQAEHLFLFNDPDKRNRQRFAEIGGIDSDLVQDTVMGLKRHQFLYIRRDGPAACIVNP